METNNGKEANEGEAKAKPEVIKLGLDLHARQVNQMSATGWVNAETRAKVGPMEVVESSRRVGQGGDQGQQLLRGRGVRLLVSPRAGQAGRDQLRSGPRPLENQRFKGQKTDRLDARALLATWRVICGAMSLVAVPSPEIEQQRSVVRYRQQLMCIYAGLRREVGPSL
jgi:hypothetical protein